MSKLRRCDMFSNKRIVNKELASQFGKFEVYLNKFRRTFQLSILLLVHKKPILSS